MGILENLDLLIKGTGETLYMTFAATLFSYILGLPIGVLVVITEKGGLKENKWIHAITGTIVNIGRSIPFIILMIAIIPFTRMIAGKIIGSTSAIVPLVVGATPFVARLIESSLKELDSGVIEAAQSMGASVWQIIYKVMIPESVPSLIRGLSITTITLIGYSAMAGTVGGGGLGDIAIRFGYHRYQDDMMIATIVILIVIVAIIQFIFNSTANKLDKRNK